MLIAFIFIAIALVAFIGIAFLTGKGLKFLYLDYEPMTEEELEEYSSHTNPIHMCRFIGTCILLGCVVAILLTVGLITGLNVINIVAISFAAACVVGALIAYIIIFKYRPMKRRYYAELKAREEEAARLAAEEAAKAEKAKKATSKKSTSKKSTTKKTSTKKSTAKKATTKKSATKTK